MHYLLPLLLLLAFVPARAQDAPVLPGDDRLDASRIRPGEATYSITLVQGAVRRDFGTSHVVFAIDEEAGVITAVRSLEMMGQKMADTLRAAWPSLAAQYHHSNNPQRRLRFTVEDGALAGDHTPPGGTPEAFELSLDGPVFDSAWIGTLASALPLAEGYTATIPAYEHEVGGLADHTVTVQGQEEVQLAPGVKVTTWVVEVSREGIPAVHLYFDRADYTMKQMRLNPQPGMEVILTAQVEGGGAGK